MKRSTCSETLGKKKSGLAPKKKSDKLALNGVCHRFEAVARMQLLIDMVQMITQSLLCSILSEWIRKGPYDRFPSPALLMKRSFSRPLVCAIARSSGFRDTSVWFRASSGRVPGVFYLAQRPTERGSIPGWWYWDHPVPQHHTPSH